MKSYIPMMSYVPMAELNTDSELRSQTTKPHLLHIAPIAADIPPVITRPSIVSYLVETLKVNSVASCTSIVFIYFWDSFSDY